MKNRDSNTLNQRAEYYNQAMVKINGANKEHYCKSICAVGCRFEKKAEHSGNNYGNKKNAKINRQRKSNGNSNAFSALKRKPKRKAMTEKYAERAKRNGINAFNAGKYYCADY